VSWLSRWWLKSQNEALLETRSQVKEQAEALRATTAKLTSAEVMYSTMDENMETTMDENMETTMDENMEKNLQLTVTSAPTSVVEQVLSSETTIKFQISKFTLQF